MESPEEDLEILKYPDHVVHGDVDAKIRYSKAAALSWSREALRLELALGEEDTVKCNKVAAEAVEVDRSNNLRSDSKLPLRDTLSVSNELPLSIEPSVDNITKTYCTTVIRPSFVSFEMKAIALLENISSVVDGKVPTCCCTCST